MSAPLVLLLAALAALPARAQPTGLASAAPEAAEAVAERLLEIRDGHLHLDGRALPPEAVPAGLDLSGLAMQMRFSGPVTPVVEVDGAAYVLQGERLVRFEESDRAGDRVYFLGQPAEPMPEHEMREAGEAAYFQQLSARDGPLYERIRREEALERESLRLAEEIRRTTDPAARARLTAQLRADLEAAFDLKQEIRTAELDQAERQVENLRAMLNTRAARKAQVIEQRMRELTGE